MGSQMLKTISAKKRLVMLGVTVHIDGSVVRGGRYNPEEGVFEKVIMIADKEQILERRAFPSNWLDSVDRDSKLLLVNWRKERDEKTLDNLNIVCRFKQTFCGFDWTGEFEVLFASYGEGVKTTIDEKWAKSVNKIFLDKEMREWFEKVTGAKFTELKHS